jgi:hypothetical protein
VVGSCGVGSLHVVVDAAHRPLEGVAGAPVDLEGVDGPLVQILRQGEAANPSILFEVSHNNLRNNNLKEVGHNVIDAEGVC